MPGTSRPPGLTWKPPPKPGSKSDTRRLLHRTPRGETTSRPADRAATERHPQRQASASYDATGRLGSIGVPALILHGRRDRPMPAGLAERMHTGIPARGSSSSAAATCSSCSPSASSSSTRQAVSLPGKYPTGRNPADRATPRHAALAEVAMHHVLAFAGLRRCAVWLFSLLLALGWREGAARR